MKCEAEDKIFGPRSKKTRTNFISLSPLQWPAEDALSPKESIYLHYYHQVRQELFPTGLNFYASSGRGIHQLLINRYGLSIRSKPCRYALLLQVALIKDGYSSENTVKYLDGFYTHSREAIDLGNLVDIMYASYLVYQYSLATSESTETRSIYARGVLLSFKLLKSTTDITAEESSVMTLMCYEVLETLLWPDPQRNLEDELENIFPVYQDSIYLLDKNSVSSNYATDSMKGSLLLLFFEIYIVYYFPKASTWCSTPISKANLDKVHADLKYIVSENLEHLPKLIQSDLTGLINSIEILPTVSTYESDNLFELSQDVLLPLEIHPDDLALGFVCCSSLILKNVLFAGGTIEDEIEFAISGMCRLMVISDYFRADHPEFWDYSECLWSLLLARTSSWATRNGKPSYIS